MDVIGERTAIQRDSAVHGWNLLLGEYPKLEQKEAAGWWEAPGGKHSVRRECVGDRIAPPEALRLKLIRQPGFRYWLAFTGLTTDLFLALRHCERHTVL
jgi:hypothetical protein